MKNFKIKTIGMLFAAILFSTNIFAQRGYGNAYGQSYGYGQGYFCSNIPNLTTVQQTKVSGLRTAHLQGMQNYRNLIAEKSARLQTLRSANNVDMKIINNIIDEINIFNNV